MTFEQQIRAIEYPPGEDAALLEKAAEIASDADAFRASVAAALAELRTRWQSALARYDSQIGEKRRDALTFERWQELNERLKELDAAITKLGLGGTEESQ